MTDKKEESKFVYHLARVGSISIGLVYVIVGITAILSLLRLKDGGADEDSIMKFMSEIPMGNVLISIILLGMVGYIIWRFYEAIKDPYEIGDSKKAIAKRIGIALSALAYAIIALSALQAMVEPQTGSADGTPTEQRLLVSKIFLWEGGNWLIGIVAAIIAFTGLVQFKYVIGKDYAEQLDVRKLSKAGLTVIRVLAWAGYFARGFILLIIAYFLFKATIESDPQEVVNTDKAFNFLGENVGHPAFVAVAAGTICYGFYMFALGLYHDFDKDLKEGFKPMKEKGHETKD